MAKLVFGYNFGKLSVAVVKSEGQTLGKGDWREIDPATMTPELQEAYGKLKEARRLAAVAKGEFEAMMTKAAGFEAKPTVAKASPKAVSLADYLATI